MKIKVLYFSTSLLQKGRYFFDKIQCVFLLEHGNLGNKNLLVWGVECKGRRDYIMPYNSTFSHHRDGHNNVMNGR